MNFERQAGILKEHLAMKRAATSRADISPSAEGYVGVERTP